MGRQGRRLARHALHHVAVAANRVHAVVEQREVGTIEAIRQPARGDRHAGAVGTTLAKRPRRGLDPRGQVVLGMPRTPAVELPEALDVLERDGGLAQALVIGVHCPHAGEVKHRVEQHRSVTARQDEPVAVRPDRVLGIEAQEALPQRVDHRSQRHGRARMPGSRPLHRIDREGADGVDAEIIEGGSGYRHGLVPASVADVSHTRSCPGCADRLDWPRASRSRNCRANDRESRDMRAVAGGCTTKLRCLACVVGGDFSPAAAMTV
jgi:hypothetical protein